MKNLSCSSARCIFWAYTIFHCRLKALIWWLYDCCFCSSISTSLSRSTPRPPTKSPTPTGTWRPRPRPRPIQCGLCDKILVFRKQLLLSFRLFPGDFLQGFTFLFFTLSTNNRSNLFYLLCTICMFYFWTIFSRQCHFSECFGQLAWQFWGFWQVIQVLIVNRTMWHFQFRLFNTFEITYSLE